MKKCLANMFLAILALAFWVSCKEGPRCIPRDEMVDIYCELFLQDQAIHLNKSISDRADTVLVYEGIFRKHGYNTDDYLYSVEYYLRDPEHMAKIMDEVETRMEASARGMKEEVEIYDIQQELLAIWEKPVSDKLPRQVSLAEKGRIVRDSTGSVQYFRYLPEERPKLDTLVLRIN